MSTDKLYTSRTFLVSFCVSKQVHFKTRQRALATNYFLKSKV
eukprot:UN22393